MTQSLARCIFIGGRDRGLNWLLRLSERHQLPLAVYCLQEDAHEQEKSSEAIARFCRRARHTVPPAQTAAAGGRDRDQDHGAGPDRRHGLAQPDQRAGPLGPALGAVGVHESLLPAYRGFAPVNWAVINGETETGVSLFFLTSTGVDNGDVVGQVVVPIREDDTAHDVYQRTSQASIELLEAHFGTLLTGTAPRSPQDDRAATYTCAPPQKTG